MELADAALRNGTQLICHAPDLLRRGSAMDSTTIAAAQDLLKGYSQKRVVHHFDEQQPLDETLELIAELSKEGLVPCIENYHRLKSPGKGEQNYSLFVELFREAKERDLELCAVLDLPRLFDAELGLVETGAAVRLVDEVVSCLDELDVATLLHLIDSSSFDLERSNWCSLGRGIIPYEALLEQIFASSCRIDAVIFEYEDKIKPLDSLPFLEKCIRDGVSIHHPALRVRWWG
jgi:hypothetical protein